jgi:hypothetical protein
VVIERRDQGGASAGFSAIYRGKRNGAKVTGGATFEIGGKPAGSTAWEATINQAR